MNMRDDSLAVGDDGRQAVMHPQAALRKTLAASGVLNRREVREVLGAVQVCDGARPRGGVIFLTVLAAYASCSHLLLKLLVCLELQVLRKASPSQDITWAAFFLAFFSASKKGRPVGAPVGRLGDTSEKLLGCTLAPHPIALG
eukprot:CAMPEP_0181452102 /NCGR_PEP_ID=MMETSP1110-20121109/29035_1 /TAXON_ID=174948 /ORGANISM="Symbiodinium sp., Strain CCMP421" /LENGTH=142 /DNA_ID=CAMNT_0023576377 /DNA_START=130 /DNA_END=560 /DNA_ORIENTATION=-